MKRLIESGLMFGNLVPVDSPALVGRYNRALKALSGRETALTEFHVDISGFSLEVADELGDPLYLNPNGVNRQFILLSTAQKSAPLLDAKFSVSRDVLRRFIGQNEAALFALTTRDAVTGELANSVFELSRPAQLFDLREITIEADTTGSLVAEAGRLSKLIERFREEEDAWWDDALIAQMIELAKKTGDVRRKPLKLKPFTAPFGNFWTSHFGGVYLFAQLPSPGLISREPLEEGAALPIERHMVLADRNRIARFLDANGLVEPIVRARGADADRILGHKMDFILLAAAGEAGLDPGGIGRRDLRKLAQDLGARLPPEFQALAALRRWLRTGHGWPRITSEHPAYFYTLRAAPGPDRMLVNQLLAELSPLDLGQLHICHKPLFYKKYRGLTEVQKRHVIAYLKREYLADKEAARRALFGSDGGPQEPGAPDAGEPEEPSERLIEIVGPWGSVLRREEERKRQPRHARRIGGTGGGHPYDGRSRSRGGDDDDDDDDDGYISAPWGRRRRR